MLYTTDLSFVTSWHLDFLSPSIRSISGLKRQFISKLNRLFYQKIELTKIYRLKKYKQPLLKPKIWIYHNIKKKLHLIDPTFDSTRANHQFVFYVNFSFC